MNRKKVLKSEGLTVLCEHIKRVKEAADNAKSAADTLDEAEQLLDVELRGLIQELQAETESLTNSIITNGLPAAGE